MSGADDTGLKIWPTVEEGDAVDFKILRLRRVKRRSPRTGEVRPFVVVEAEDWVNVIALTPEGEVVLVRQYRHGTSSFTLEVPGGIVDPGEQPEDAGARELREETGYVGGRPRVIGVVHPNPAFLTNRCATVLIEGARKVAEPTPDPGEDLEVLTAPRADLPRLVREGAITHSLVVAAFFHLGLLG